MAKPKILVTGATGGTGYPVVAELLAKGFPVRAAVHRRDARGEALERQGVEIVVADLYDPDTMPANLREAHERNDEVLERIYIGRRFRNDTERLEKLFELYTKMSASQGTKKKAEARA